MATKRVKRPMKRVAARVSRVNLLLVYRSVIWWCVGVLRLYWQHEGNTLVTLAAKVTFTIYKRAGPGGIALDFGWAGGISGIHLTDMRGQNARSLRPSNAFKSASWRWAGAAFPVLKVRCYLRMVAGWEAGQIGPNCDGMTWRLGGAEWLLLSQTVREH